MIKKYVIAADIEGIVYWTGEYYSSQIRYAVIFNLKEEAEMFRVGSEFVKEVIISIKEI